MQNVGVKLPPQLELNSVVSCITINVNPFYYDFTVVKERVVIIFNF